MIPDIGDPIRVGPPIVEPVTVAQMRDHLRLDSDAGEDAGQEALLAGLIAAARAAVEDLTRRVLPESRWRVVFAAWPDAPAVVPLAPLRGVAALARLGPDGAPGAPLMDGLVHLDPAAGEASRLVFATRPDGLGAGEGVAVDLIAGHAAGALPPPLVQAVRLLVARWFENRGDAEVGALPGDVLALAAPFRRLRL